MLQVLPCYRMLFILFIADSMGVSESLEGRYLQSLCQVIKSSVGPQKDKSIGGETVSLRNNALLIPFLLVGGYCCCLQCPVKSFCWLSVAFLSIWLSVHLFYLLWFFMAPYVPCLRCGRFCNV